MDRTTILVAALGMCLLGATCAAAQEDSLDDARLIDLTGDLARDVSNTPPRCDAIDMDLYSCGLKDKIANNGLIGFVRAGVIIMSRDNARARPSSTVYNINDGAERIDTADMNMGSPTGLDFMLLSPLGNALELEIRYFGVTGWKASRYAAAPGGVRYDGFGVETLADAEQFNTSSRLYNVEVGLRPSVRSGIPLLIGFRTLQLHERFEAWGFRNGTSMVDAASRTNNFLWGAQIGAEPYLGSGALRLESMLKAGIYGNVATQQTTSDYFGESITRRRSQMAFVGELGVAGIYQVTRMMAVRAGYELLWVKGVALAPDQSRETNLLTGAASLNSSSAVFYQGIMASVDFVF